MRFLNALKLTVTIILTGSTLFATSGQILTTDGQKTEFTVIENAQTTLVVNNTVGEISTLEVIAGPEIYTRLLLPGYSRTQLIGSPELPVMRKLIEVPAGASFRFEILSSSYTDISLGDLGYEHTLIPSQPPAPKNGQVPDFQINPTAYSTNAFYPQHLVAAENLGTLRSVNIGRLDIFPVQYNPVTHILRVYELLEIRVTFEHGDPGATLDNKARYENAYFKSISRSLVNYQPLASRDTIAKYPITYVIIADPMFEAQLQPFIEWKTKKGFHVIDGYTNDPQVGSTTYSIKSFIQDLYNNPAPGRQAPTFVLFVGDIDQVPTWTGQAAGHVTDLYYCEYTGDDFPEIYYGRFSAQNTDQLQPQIDKTLMYEQFTMPDPSYLEECVMIAGMDGTYGGVHGNGQILYGTENYFNESNGLLSQTYLYPQSGANAANIRQDISDGVCYANYTAHGSPSGWADPEFSIGHISQMTNAGKYALLVGNCCSTSEYQVGECFGEALLRAEDKGSLGYIGASNSTYWDEDYYWGVGVGPISGTPPSYSQTSLGAYDRTFHTHGEPRDEWYTTMGQMIFAGNLAVTEGSPGSSEYYWEAYNLMGDPSLMVYYSLPPQMEVTYQPLLPLGTSSFTINTDEPFAYVAVSMNGELHGAMQADASGQAVMSLLPIFTPGMADIVITSQNREPFIGTVLAANPDGPFILLENHSTTELAGNKNSKSEGNEVIGLNITLKNWGNSDGNDVVATITTSDPYVTISDGSEDCGTVPAQSSLSIENAFSVILDPAVPNGHQVVFDLAVEDPNRESWSSEFKILLSAPVIHCNSITVDDTEGGNGNGRLDPGETAEISYILGNQGGVMATGVTVSLLARSGFITISDPLQMPGNISLFGTKTVTFHIAVDDQASDGTVVPFEFNLVATAYEMSEVSPVKIGLICEDFETGNFSKFNWQHAGSQQWTVTPLFPFEGNYSIKSGAIQNNESSEVTIQYTSMVADSITFYRKVSSESGDKLRFYIDNQLKDEWSGTTGGWKRASYPAYAGTHTYKWIYSKDGSGIQGSDAAWLDYINFPPPLTSTIYAGDDEMLCGGEIFQAAAQATNYSTLQWTTSGSGTFDDVNAPDPVYTPSEDDLLAGEVTLYLSMTDVDGILHEDELLLSFTGIPAAPLSPSGPGLVDLTSAFTSDYTVQAVQDATIFTWIVDPSEAGMMVNRGETGTVVWNRNWAGTAAISVLAVNQCGESVPSPGLTVTVTNGTVGFPEINDNNWQVIAYPNPAHGYLRIGLTAGEPTHVNLFMNNLLGVQVHQQKMFVNGTATCDVPVTGLAPGMYLVLVSDGMQSRSVKVIVR